jgi:hypothetical protein
VHGRQRTVCAGWRHGICWQIDADKCLGATSPLLASPVPAPAPSPLTPGIAPGSRPLSRSSGRPFRLATTSLIWSPRVAHCVLQRSSTLSPYGGRHASITAWVRSSSKQGSILVKSGQEFTSSTSGPRAVRKISIPAWPSPRTRAASSANLLSVGVKSTGCCVAPRAMLLRHSFPVAVRTVAASNFPPVVTALMLRPWNSLTSGCKIRAPSLSVLSSWKACVRNVAWSARRTHRPPPP